MTVVRSRSARRGNAATPFPPLALPLVISFSMAIECLYGHNVSGHRRRLVRRTVERLVQLIHFAWPRRLSPENWCLGVENSVFFGFWGYFGVFLVIFGRETGTFSHFLA